MAINQTIADFRNKAARDDFARKNLYRVMSLKCAAIEFTEDDLLYCTSAQIPGRDIPHGAVSYMGMKMNYPLTSVSYENVDSYKLSFYLDRRSTMAERFEVASRYMFNDLSSTGDSRFPSSEDTLTLAVLNFDLEPIEYITFNGVSFKSFGPVDVDWGDSTGEALKIDVTFTYISYTRTGSDTVFVAT